MEIQAELWFDQEKHTWLMLIRSQPTSVNYIHISQLEINFGLN